MKCHFNGTKKITSSFYLSRHEPLCTVGNVIEIIFNGKCADKFRKYFETQKWKEARIVQTPHARNRGRDPATLTN